MDEVDEGQPVPSPAGPVSVGEQLRAARQAHGLSLADVAARTRVPLRHLTAIEAGDYAGLPSPTYAVGFARSYARAVGADEVAIAARTRADIDRLGVRQPEYVPYETADPSRVPSRAVAIAALGVALAVLILAALYFGTTLFRGGATIGQPVTDASAPVTTAPVPAVAPTQATPTGGQVSFVANDEVWMRVYDADNKTLYLGTMKPGDRYDVPANAKNPMINVGRPDKLTVTLNGSTVPALGTGERAIKDVRVDGAAMAARIAGQPVPGASPTPPASDALTAATSSGTKRVRPRTTDRPRPRLTETQRANLQSAANPPAAAGSSSAP